MWGGVLFAPAAALLSVAAIATYHHHHQRQQQLNMTNNNNTKNKSTDKPKDAPDRKLVVVQTAPAVRVAIAEAVGLAPGAVTQGQLVTALRKLGFFAVFDTLFAADLTVPPSSLRSPSPTALFLHTAIPVLASESARAWPAPPRAASVAAPQPVSTALFLSSAPSFARGATTHTHLRVASAAFFFQTVPCFLLRVRKHACARRRSPHSTPAVLLMMGFFPGLLLPSSSDTTGKTASAFPFGAWGFFKRRWWGHTQPRRRCCALCGRGRRT